MADLVQWLTAQLDEDRGVALAACDGGDGWNAAEQASCECCSNVRTDKGALVCTPDDRDAPHIAEHDPARVLREVEAHRRIVELHAIAVEKTDVPPFDSCTGERNPEEYDVTCVICGWASDDPTSACPTLRLLASVYADRDGYQEGWTP